MPVSAGSLLHNISIVSADVIATTITRRTLALTGARIVEFQSPQLLLHALPLPSPGALLVDLFLPEMSGLELLKRVRIEGCYQPVIFNATHIDLETLSKLFNRGAFAFIKRPYQPLELTEVVQRALALDQATAPYHRRARHYYHCFSRLSPQERKITSLLGEGQSARAIAEELAMSPRTIENHRVRILRKFEVKSVIELVEARTAYRLLRAQGITQGELEAA
ncbi:MAG: response regulator [Gammaproteobacteria bacterium]|nr:response regulator [Gammaproteobacteria bacterium]